MFSHRIEVEADLVVLTPLSVGSGETKISDRVMYTDKKTDTETQPQVLSIAKDHNGNPYLPASSIKGVIRALLSPDADKEPMQIKQAFGYSESEENHVDEDNSTMAKLYVYNAYLKKACAQSDLPYWNKSASTAIITQTTINRKYGSADDQKLYHREIVLPETKFTIRLQYFLEDKNESVIMVIEELLNTLTHKVGIAIGAKQREGMGRVCLDENSLLVKYKEIDEDGELQEFDLSERYKQQLKPVSQNKNKKSITLTLNCDGPFIIIGKRNENEKEAKNNEQDYIPQLEVLKFKKNNPWLPGSSLLGSMRAECAWLHQLNAMKDKSLSPLYQRDDREIDFDPDYETEIEISQLTKALSPTERLFGVTGWRGLLNISEILLKNKPEEIELTSVKIDRFSGAPIDNALFTAKTVLSPKFQVTLSLDNRAIEEDEVTFDEFFNYLFEKGITLGHGGNKGFGWFDVSLINEDLQ